MAKSPPEKLAAALRANLKRRKQAKAASPSKPPPGPAANPPKKSPEKQGLASPLPSLSLGSPPG